MSLFGLVGLLVGQQRGLLPDEVGLLVVEVGAGGLDDLEGGHQAPARVALE